ncbi:MAG: RNA 2'-phosphotransferase [Albidovulum sp.]
MNDPASASKFMSLVLRHRPDTIGIELDAEGWVAVAELVEKSGGKLTDGLVRQIVRDNEKQRFALSEDGLGIRANQGHSVVVDLGLSAIKPPERLFHGTATRFIASIMDQGLKPGMRQFVHLSPDQETAIKVGQRHGKPVVLNVDAGALHSDGGSFYVSHNGVWLIGSVPARYLSVAD